jgi:hypothetical protein
MSCQVCEQLVALALEHCQAVRAPVGSRVVGVEEAAVWHRLQTVADRELLQAVSVKAECREVAA